MRKLLLAIAVALAGCADAGVSKSGAIEEWSFSKTGPVLQNEHVVTVKGHGKTCYVFVEDMNARSAAALLWCEADSDGKN